MNHEAHVQQHVRRELACTRGGVVFLHSVPGRRKRACGPESTVYTNGQAKGFYDTKPLAACFTLLYQSVESHARLQAVVAGGESPVDGAPAEQHASPSTQACAAEDTPDRRKRACTSRRVRLADTDSDGQEDDHDKCSNEMLQKRLRTLTDEKEIKRLKRYAHQCIFAECTISQSCRAMSHTSEHLQIVEEPSFCPASQRAPRDRKGAAFC